MQERQSLHTARKDAEGVCPIFVLFLKDFLGKKKAGERFITSHLRFLGRGGWI